MKRDYSNDKSIAVHQYLYNAYYDTDRDYRDPIFYQDVPTEFKYLKNNSLYAGDDANRHVASIRERIYTALSVLSQFYSEVDTTSLDIYGKANNILLILNEINTSMEKINNILNGSEEYSGKTITEDDIKAAGINQANCGRSKLNFFNGPQFVEEMKALKEKGGILSPEEIEKLQYIFDLYSQIGSELTDSELREYVDAFELLGNDDLTDELLDDFMKNDAAVEMYLADIKVSNENGSLSPEDMDRIERIYNWYVKNRFESQDDEHVDDMNDQTLINCIDAYEILNPDAKKITDTFFEPGYELKDATVDKNILRIKYSIYTCDPTTRDMIFGYMPLMTLNLVNSGVCCTNGKDSDGNKTVTLNLDLHRFPSGNCCSFFHECGHGIDHLSCDDANLSTSKDFAESLSLDSRDRLYADLEDYNDSVLDSEKLSPAEKDQIVKYIFNFDNNPNIIRTVDEDPFVPYYWSPAQVEAYKYLREVYGYNRYVYPFTAKVYMSAQRGWFCTAERPGIVNDIFGGMTNNKFCNTGHGYNFKDKKQSDFVTFATYCIAINEESYYYSGTQVNTEFYAECFEYKALGRDMGTTKTVFGRTVEQFEEAYKDAYAKMKSN